MLKTILLFIKTHAIATAITTTVVVTTAVATPVVVSNYMLDKNVKDNLDMLVSSNFKVDADNQETENNQTTADNKTAENNQVQDEIKSVVNTEEPLTFRIEKVETEQVDELVVDYTQGNEAINNAKSRGVEYKIVPSYDKDFSKWTKQEKEEYQKALEDIRKMAEEEYQKVAKSELDMLKNAEEEGIRVSNQIESSYSKTYSILCFYHPNGRIMSSDLKYNSYTKLYSGTGIYREDCEIVTKYVGNLDILFEGIPVSGITREEFRNKLYPKFVQRINQEVEEELRQEELDKLNELYHLSD